MNDEMKELTGLIDKTVTKKDMLIALVATIVTPIVYFSIGPISQFIQDHPQLHAILFNVMVGTGLLLIATIAFIFLFGLYIILIILLKPMKAENKER